MSCVRCTACDSGRGTPHVHWLLWIDHKKSGLTLDSIYGEKPGEWEKVQRYVEDHLSCWLPGVPQEDKDRARDDSDEDAAKQHEEQEKPSYQPGHHEFDEDHPCGRNLSPTELGKIRKKNGALSKLGG